MVNNDILILNLDHSQSCSRIHKCVECSGIDESKISPIPKVEEFDSSDTISSDSIDYIPQKESDLQKVHLKQGAEKKVKNKKAVLKNQENIDVRIAAKKSKIKSGI